MGKLGKVIWFETKTHHVNAVYLFHTAFAGIEFTEVAFSLFLLALHLAANTNFKLRKIARRFILLNMIYKDTCIINIPLGLFAVPLNGIVNRARNSPVNMQQYIQFIL